MSLNSEEAFRQFYEAHANKVRGLIFRLVGESALSDVTQEAFMKAWENRDKFRGESEASTWLYRIAYNCAVDYLRKAGKKNGLEAELVQDSLEKDLSNRELVELVLSSLDVEHRAVVVLFYLEDQSVKEISVALQIPEGTVKSRMNHARNKMSEILSKKGVSV
ncbi:RNA polymerase sigma factor [Bdellovibrio bacteriovorus]|uniref:RNA polymerase sigma factor n=1 Tax=Bdellovibrio TaxID=958 RepID=UPI0035A9678D